MALKKQIDSIFIWILFLTSALFAVGSNLAGFGLDSEGNNLAAFLAIALPFFAVLSHAACVLGAKRALFFLLLSFFTGFIFEAAAVNFGLISGGSYSYDMAGSVFAGVPLSIPVFWFVFIYTVYGLMNAVIIYKQGKTPVYNNGSLKYLLSLIFINAFLIMIIDLIMDPVMIAWGEWSWQGGGLYFDIPAENFLGWLAIGLIAGGIFRTYEYYFPANRNIIDKNVHLIPVLGYFTVILSFTYFAFALALYSLAAASIFLYLPTIILLLKITGNLSLTDAKIKPAIILPIQKTFKQTKIPQPLPRQK